MARENRHWQVISMGFLPAEQAYVDGMETYVIPISSMISKKPVPWYFKIRTTKLLQPWSRKMWHLHWKCWCRPKFVSGERKRSRQIGMYEFRRHAPHKCRRSKAACCHCRRIGHIEICQFLMSQPPLNRPAVGRSCVSFVPSMKRCAWYSSTHHHGREAVPGRACGCSA